MLRRLVIFLVNIAMVISFTSPLRVLVAAEIKMGVEEIDYPPFYHVQNGQYNGFARVLFDDFAQRHGHKIIYRPLPIKRLYEELIKGKIDLKFPDNPAWAKDVKNGAAIVYSSAVVGFTDGVLVPSNKLQMTLEQIETIGYVRGFNPWTLMGYISRNEIQSREVNSLDSLIRLTQSERISCAYFNIDVAKHHMKTKYGKKSPLIFSPRLPHDKSNYVLSTIKPLPYMVQLNDYLKSSHADAIRTQFSLRLHHDANSKGINP